MSRITASRATDLRTIDLYGLVEEDAVATEFLDNVNAPSPYGLAYTYQDAIELTIGSPAGTTYFGGTGFVVNASGAVTGGTLTGFLSDLGSGSTAVHQYAIEGISLSAASVYNASQTVSTTDDMTLYRAALAGSDLFNLSAYADAADGFAGNDTMNGNGGNDILLGNAGNDSLNGGTGSDNMAGGTGNDSYVIDVAGDIVTEAANAGTDTIRSYVTKVLGANVENLVLLGTSALGGTGNTLNNAITGNGAANLLQGSSGHDVLKGMGGADILVGGTGNDQLYGGTGTDTFRFANTPSATTNLDQVKDFVSVDDRIQIENAVFTQVGAAGALTSAAFWLGTAAHDSSDRIVYNKTTGAMYYDADGTGASAPVLFAQFVAGTAVSLGDLFVI